ncbi:MAG: hypothetical protein KDE31_26460, partial [Caldilineaceae bacterium]|nr:hypothetical protein [Caldilineaceae bacterium]
MITADASLTKLFAKLDNQTKTAYRDLPAKMELQHFTEDLFNFLFPINCRREHRAAVQYTILADQLQRMLAPLDVDATTVTDEFFAALPELHEILLADAQATLDFDPAATSLEEVITTYPGFYTIVIYRLAHELVKLGVPILPRMLTEHAHS